MRSVASSWSNRPSGKTAVIALYAGSSIRSSKHRHDHGAVGEVEIDIRSAEQAPVSVVPRRRLLDLSITSSARPWASLSLRKRARLSCRTA